MHRALSWVFVASVSMATPLVGADPSVADFARLSEASSGFGSAVAVVDGDVLVGEGATTLREGAVYVYRRGADGLWAQEERITGGDAEPGDGFGAVLATDGERLLVGASEQDEGRGQAILFERDGTGSWVEVAVLGSSEVEVGDAFGSALALRGERAVIGAPDAAGGRGAVLVFEPAGQGGWEQVARLVPEGAQERDAAGTSVAVIDDLLLVGAPGRSGGQGAVHLFERDNDTGEWREVGELGAMGTSGNTRFGTRIAADSDRAIVTAPRFDGGRGAAFLFSRDADGASFSGGRRLSAFDGQAEDVFGTALALSSEGLWVGAPRAGGAVGAVYFFEANGDEWAGVDRIASHQADRGDQFGGTVASAGDVAAVGLVGADNRAGQVAIFERGAAGGWSEVELLYSEPEALPVVTGETVECVEGKAGINPCENVELLSFLPISEIGGGRGIRLNDVWGWRDPETGGEFALVGRTDGMAFVDISDRNDPIFVGEMLRTEGSPTASWRDMKVYKDHLFVVADASGQHGMQIFDLARLREFDGEPIAFDPDLTYDRIHSAHNIALNEETGYAYTVGNSGGGETCGGGLHMIDVSEPLNPTFVGCFADPLTGRAASGYTHDAQCVVYRGPHEEFEGREICFGANETALSIADVTDKDDPVALSRAAYPNVGYTHQVWLTEDHRYLYMNDELDVLSGLVDNTRTIIWDVTDLEDPQVAGEYFSPVRASAHNLYIVDDLMYQSNYSSGLRVVDISDRENPEEVGYIDTAPFEDTRPGFVGSWSNFPFFEDGTVIVTSIREGIYLVRYAPEVPVS